MNYFMQLLFIVIASFFTILGNYIYMNNCLDKIKDRKKVKKISLFTIFVYYTIFLFNTTLFARRGYVNAYNLIPFQSILEISKNGTFFEIFINIFGNFFIFMPLEYFLIELFSIKKWSVNFIVSFVILFAIESVQYLFKLGIFDVDDILLCVFGMMIFYFLYEKGIQKRNK